MSLEEGGKMSGGQQSAVAERAGHSTVDRRLDARAPMVVLIEFNELCPSLLRRFMGEGALPSFRRLYESSTVFTTDAQEAVGDLEPWVQWPTVHSGMSASEHGIVHLGDGRRLEQRCIAEILSDAGLPVGVCGSMNLNYRRLKGYVLPDPWDKAGVAHPPELQRFYATVSSLVQESSRDHVPSPEDLLSFGPYLLRHGLSARTVEAFARQLWDEARDKRVRWRRASLLDRLQYDLFRHLNRRHRVRFATFFSNSTAHYQHYYWRNMEPERFAVPPADSDHETLRDAIPFGYRAMDRLLGRILRDYVGARLVLCTALSQQPWLETSKCTYRPRRFDDFLEFARIPAQSVGVKPVMAEQFHLVAPTSEAADLVESRLRDLTVDGGRLMSTRREGNSIFAGCRLEDWDAPSRVVTRSADGAQMAFDRLFYRIHSMRSGRHHPDGALWVQTGRHRVVEEKVPLTAVAPTLLAHFAVPAPAYMRTAPLVV
jgi:hypothetical protein